MRWRCWPVADRARIAPKAWVPARGRRRCSGTAVGPVAPAVCGPRSAYQTPYSDDGVGEIEERVDDGGPALVAAGEAVEGVVPGVGPFHVPPPTCLDWCLLTLVCDAAVQAGFVEQGAGLVGVVAGVPCRRWRQPGQQQAVPPAQLCGGPRSATQGGDPAGPTDAASPTVSSRTRRLASRSCTHTRSRRELKAEKALFVDCPQLAGSA